MPRADTRKYRNDLTKQGLCWMCDSKRVPSAPGQTLCEDHILKQRDYNRSHREKVGAGVDVYRCGRCHGIGHNRRTCHLVRKQEDQ